MIHFVILGLIAGLLVANGVPHFVKGVIGQKHATPFGRPSSSVVNVIWGWLNFVVAGLLLFYIRHELLSAAVIAGFATGTLVQALFSAWHWSKHPEHNG